MWGISRTADGIVGDVDFETVQEVAGAVTPMPGGTGPMTIACLLQNTLAAAPHAGSLPGVGVQGARAEAARPGRVGRVGSSWLARLRDVEVPADGPVEQIPAVVAEHDVVSGGPGRPRLRRAARGGPSSAPRRRVPSARTSRTASAGLEPTVSSPWLARITARPLAQSHGDALAAIAGEDLDLLVVEEGVILEEQRRFLGGGLDHAAARPRTGCPRQCARGPPR